VDKMPAIKISEEILTYNKIIYVDAVYGSDGSGDGSESNPYQTFLKGYNESTNGDALYLIGNKNTNYDSYNGAINKDIDIIGDGVNSKIDVGLGTNLFSNSAGTINLIRLNLAFNEMFRYSEFGEQHIHNCILETNDGRIGYHGSDSAGSSYIYNCSMISHRGLNSGQPLIRNTIIHFTSVSDWNIGWTGNKYVEKSLFNDDFYDEFQEVSSVPTTTRSWEYDSEYNILGYPWENVGVGENPDGTQANIGVYGGVFGWGEWYLSFNIIKENYTTSLMQRRLEYDGIHKFRNKSKLQSGEGITLGTKGEGEVEIELPAEGKYKMVSITIEEEGIFKGNIVETKEMTLERTILE
jgi:hypothetical protein